VLVDPDAEFPSASLFKLTVMYEVFKQREAGTLSFDEELVLTERHISYDLGTLDRPAGSKIRLADALERMITISDNSSAILLTDRVGAFAINQDMRSIGLKHTRLIEDDLVTSPGDMLTFLEMLARGQGVSPRASAEMVQLMARQRVNDRIPRNLPDSAIVAHKTGNLPGVVNDVGIVYTPDATFIVAVLVDETREEGRAALMTADIARLSFDHFRESPSIDVIFPTPAPTPTSRPRPATPVVRPSPTPVEEEPDPIVDVVERPTRRPQPTATDEPPAATPTTAPPTAPPTLSPTRTVAPLQGLIATPVAIPLTPIRGTLALPTRPVDASPQR
jgi:beta-lactamase class A